MEFFRIKRDIPFMRYALIFNVISLLTFLVAVGALFTKGLNFGVDFTGGGFGKTRCTCPKNYSPAFWKSDSAIRTTLFEQRMYQHLPVLWIFPRQSDFARHVDAGASRRRSPVSAN